MSDGGTDRRAWKEEVTVIACTRFTGGGAVDKLYTGGGKRCEQCGVIWGSILLGTTLAKNVFISATIRLCRKGLPLNDECCSQRSGLVPR